MVLMSGPSLPSRLSFIGAKERLSMLDATRVREDFCRWADRRGLLFSWEIPISRVGRWYRRRSTNQAVPQTLVVRLAFVFLYSRRLFVAFPIWIASATGPSATLRLYSKARSRARAHGGGLYRGRRARGARLAGYMHKRGSLQPMDF